MLIRETYKLFGSRLEHFDISYQKYLQSKIRNEKDFILDLVESLEFYEIENLISKYHERQSIKEKDLIDFIDGSKDCIRIRDEKLYRMQKKYKEVLRELSYPRSISFFVGELCAIEKIKEYSQFLQLTQSFLNTKTREIQKNIIDQANLLINYLVGLKTIGIDDALSAYMVFDRGRANKIFEKMLISGSVPSEFAFEALLNDLQVKNVEKPFLPNISFENILHIDKVNIKKLSESLYSYKLPFKTFSQIRFVNPKDIKNDKLFKELLTDLFQLIDKRVLKKDIEIFYYSITNQLNIFKYTDEEMLDTQNKFNDTFANNQEAGKLLCSILYILNKSKFIKVNSLMWALDDYFNPEVQLSYATLKSLIYEETIAKDNFISNEKAIEKIIKNCLSKSKNIPLKNNNYKKDILHCISVI